MASGNDLIKYMTVQVVQYMETPRAERKQARASAKAQREHWLTRWFGVGAMSLLIWRRSKREENQS
ncbi:YqzE family protein [Paenibacillus sp. NPDC058071]|uniref:YqzE family protein n=1 Tax=Paenibacillus sp. NPDC058071 TaxID=3346326 RepID=UPI0036DCC04B